MTTSFDRRTGMYCHWPARGPDGFTVKAFCDWAATTVVLIGGEQCLPTAYAVAAVFAADPFLQQLERNSRARPTRTE